MIPLREPGVKALKWSIMRLTGVGGEGSLCMNNSSVSEHKLGPTALAAGIMGVCLCT